MILKSYIINFSEHYCMCTYKIYIRHKAERVALQHLFHWLFTITIHSLRHTYYYTSMLTSLLNLDIYCICTITTHAHSENHSTSYWIHLHTHSPSDHHFTNAITAFAHSQYLLLLAQAPSLYPYNHYTCTITVPTQAKGIQG